MQKTPKILIAYASMTGNTEEAAFLLLKAFKDLGAEVDIDEMEMISPQEFAKHDICVIATFSYDSGDEIVPYEVADFFEELGEMDLSGKIYGVLGSGQDFYEWYCGAVDEFEKQFEKAGAQKGTESMKFEWDISTPEDQENLTVFSTNLLKAFSQNL